MRKRIAFVLLVLAVLAALCSCAVKKNSSDEAKSVQAKPAVTRLYGRVAKNGSTDCSDVIVTVTGGGWSYTTNSDANGNYTLDVDPATYTEIDFDCSCWSATYQLKDPIVVAEGAEVKLPDYRLKPDHYFELVDSKVFCHSL